MYILEVSKHVIVGKARKLMLIAFLNFRDRERIDPTLTKKGTDRNKSVKNLSWYQIMTNWAKFLAIYE